MLPRLCREPVQFKNNDIMKPFKNQSIALVKLNPETNRLQITKQAISYLCSLSNPIAVTTIAGLYRTGKSFLVSRLLPSGCSWGQQECAFRVGTTTQSMTKGLNILAHPINVQCRETGEQIHYLLIDSEGIGSCEQSVKYDMDLLILIFLISSTVVYNSMGAIDEMSLEQLQVVLKLKACVDGSQHSYEGCSFRYNSDNPKFMWILRDFALQLVDKNGKEITSDQYLQQCLEQSPGTAPETRKKNEIRRAIKENLGERHCYTLVRPTIKQDDLQHLSNFRPQQQSKIRTEFLGQLQCLKESLFAGNQSDIKKINGQTLSGKLFARILSQYLQIINNNQLPKVKDVWSSVMKENNEQSFDQLMAQLRKQIKSIKLPIPKQELKLKINEIENRIYKTLQKSISSEQQFKSYHKQFLKAIQKMNKELKQRNDELRKNSLMAQLHLFVKENLNYDALKPSSISEIMKQFIDRIKLKIGGAEEGYQYLITILTDVFFVLEQKSVKIDRQFAQIKQSYASLTLDKNNAELSLINLKKQYHQSLKTIAKLQQGQADADKNYSLTKNKVYNYQTKIAKLELEVKQGHQQYERDLKQSQERSKLKTDQMSTQIKKLRQQNSKLEEQLLSIRDKVNNQDLTSKKQQIFQQKMRESFDRFHRERLELNKQIEGYKKNIGAVNDKYNQMKNLYEKQCEKQKSIEEAHDKKEKNLLRQFENLKQTFKQTKASYQKTYETYHTTEQKLNTLTTSTSKKQKFQTPAKDLKDIRVEPVHQRADDGNKMMKKYYETELEKLKEENKIERERLQQRISNLEKQLERRQTDKQMHFMEAKQYKQKCLKLENDIILANEKFNQFLKQIETAKQKQRMIYQQSIVRLLKNIEKRDSENRDSTSGLVTEEKGILNPGNFNRRREMSQNVKESVSFGNVFRTK